MAGRIPDFCDLGRGDVPMSTWIVTRRLDQEITIKGFYGVRESNLPVNAYVADIADARLIAAAPDLLDAARLAVLNFRREHAGGAFLGDDSHEAWTALDAAIAKAVGR
jgi:hypothetical protein